MQPPACRAAARAAGFTLIELLIVVAIIAILAAIAVPNFLEAQVRSKVSRAKADMRSLATAVEAFAVDHNKYPPNSPPYNTPPPELSTPIAYITSALIVDPFMDKERQALLANPELARYLTYMTIVPVDQLANISPPPTPEAVDGPPPFFNGGALGRYGPWRMLSNGPDRVYSYPSSPPPVDRFNPNPILAGSDIPYDATNGTTSDGNILRTQRSPEGVTWQ